MDPDLLLSLANNAKQWLALSLSYSTAEKLAFNKVHDDFYRTYGGEFMTHVYRVTIEQALQNMPEQERTKLLAVFQTAMDQAIDEHYSTTRRAVSDSPPSDKNELLT